MKTLIDPRKYTEVFPESNIIINQALQVIDNKLTQDVLNQTIRDILKNKNDALINVALNLSPNELTARAIWQSLNCAINLNDDNSINSPIACFFAIPVIIVAGSKNRTKLMTTVDTEKLNNFFAENNIISSGQDYYISGRLVEPQTIAKIKPSQLYYWVRNSQNAKLWLPIEVQNNAIEVLGEGVFLRFLLGIVRGENGCLLNDVIDINKYKEKSMQLMQFIVEETKTDGVTLFPIPYQPVDLSESFTVGDNHRKEIAIQVALSNAVRKIREEGQTPNVEIKSIIDAIEINVINVDTLKTHETSLWHLTRFDNFSKVINILTDLLQEMNIGYKFS